VAYACANLGAARATAPTLWHGCPLCSPPRWLEKLLDELHKPASHRGAADVSIECPRLPLRLTIRDRELGVGWLHRRANEPYPVPLAGCACMAMTGNLRNAAVSDAMPAMNEDVEMCMRCGFSVICDHGPNAVVAHWFKKSRFPVGWHDYCTTGCAPRAALRRGTAGANSGRAAHETPSFPTRQQPAGERCLDALGFVRNLRKHDADWFWPEV